MKNNLVEWCKENNKEYLLSEWSNENEQSPEEYTYGSNKSVKWVCSKGHTFKQIIRKRTTRDYNCPFCSGHGVLKGYNDLETLYPELTKEWHPTKNEKLPSEYSSGSGKRVYRGHTGAG